MLRAGLFVPRYLCSCSSWRQPEAALVKEWELNAENSWIEFSFCVKRRASSKMVMRCCVGMKWQHVSIPIPRLSALRRRKTTLEPLVVGRKRPWDATGIADRLLHKLAAAPLASLSMGSGILSFLYLMLRMIFRVDGPHWRTRERVEDASFPDSCL